MKSKEDAFLPVDWVASAQQAGWFKIFLPPSLGGPCATMVDALFILRQAAIQDGSLGWAVNLGAGASWFYPYVSFELAQKCWGFSHAIVAGSGEMGHLKWNKAGNGLLSGYWSRCTAAPWASWFTLNAKTEEGQVWTCVVPRHQVTLHSSTWTQFGLKGSGTYGVETQNIFVPPHQIFSIEKPQWSAGHFTENWPFPIFARICMSASFFGLWQGLIQQAIQHNGKSSNHGRIERHIQNWENQLHREAIQPGPSILSLVTLHKEAMDLAMAVYRESGMRIGQLGHPLHVAWADFMTAAHHPYVW